MNIPLSVIEPFGVGIPVLKFDAKQHSLRISQIIFNYAFHTSNNYSDILTINVCQQAEWLAMESGAKTAHCSLYQVCDSGTRIFTLRFKAKGYPREASFGFVIGPELPL